MVYKRKKYHRGDTQLKKGWKTKRRQKDLDEIDDDLKDEKADKLLNQKVDFDKPGAAQHYCIHCASRGHPVFALMTTYHLSFYFLFILLCAVCSSQPKTFKCLRGSPTTSPHATVLRNEEAEAALRAQLQTTLVCSLYIIYN
ncbi:uncharacterized protein LOC117172515 isoform X1 [Belonocnema kinseyi]|uniref:uncharacterized protein LOC117172515 isoform X1 n=1 Tax=Belonocnema kinseyi TaxID=2817044 RepID=UPI00143DF1A2|nr:uncharacterized protein LOC117172515 isoform X1 [Belonocnema kinseyi]